MSEDACQISVFIGDLHEVSESDNEILSKAEHVRADRIANCHFRNRFIVRRAFLRRSIGQFIDLLPYKGEIVIDTAGKPHLPEPYSFIHFNLTHSDLFMGVVLSRSVPVGIDIETLDRAFPLELVKFIFNKREICQLSKAVDPHLMLMRGWTSKEAVLKCIGRGFLMDPKRIHVFLKGHDEHLKAFEVLPNEYTQAIYRLIPLPSLDSAIGVVAIRDMPVTPEFWRVTDRTEYVPLTPSVVYGG